MGQLTVIYNIDYLQNVSNIVVNAGNNYTAQINIDSTLTGEQTYTYNFRDFTTYSALNVIIYPQTDYEFPSTQQYNYKARYQSNNNMIYTRELTNNVSYLQAATLDARVYYYLIIGTSDNPINAVSTGGNIKTVTLRYGIGGFTNCSCNKSNASVLSVGDVIILTADSGYYFNYDYIEFNYDSDKIQMVFNDDKTVATYTITESTPDNLTFEPNIVATAITSGKITFKYNGYSLINCSSNYSDNTELTQNDTLIFTANNGYEFNQNAILGTSDNSSVWYDMVLDDDNSTQTLSLNGITSTDLTLLDNITAYKITTSLLGGFSYIYNITQKELESLSKEIFIDITSTSTETIDYTQYITALYKIPFNIPNSLKSETKSAIRLDGLTGVSTQSTELNDWYFTIDGGLIQVPLTYNNVYDYINTDAVIYVPYFGNISLDIKYVIGQTITIKYYVNLFNGITTLNLISSLTDNVIYQNNKQIGINLPFYRNDFELVNFTENSSIIEKTYTAFINIIRNNPYISNGFNGKKVDIYEKLENITNGYVVADDIELDNTIPQEIQTEIKQILSGGVFI